MRGDRTAVITVGCTARLAVFLDKLPEKLKRVTSGGALIPQIDGLRFIAIMSVFLGHVAAYTKGKLGAQMHLDFSGSWWTEHFGNFAAGVELFFAISGFIIAMPFLKAYGQGRRPPAIGPYFVRRLTRLEPPFVLSMILTFIALVLWRHDSPSELFPHFLATIAYLHGPLYLAKSPISFVTWSLEIEVQFYIIAPLLLMVLRRYASLRRLFWPGLAITCIMAHQLLIGSYPRLWVFIPSYFAFFLVGVLAADFAQSAGFWRNEARLRWDLVALLGLACIFLNSSILSIAERLMMAFGAFLTMIAAFRSVYFKRWLANRWITSIGGMCYSIYLLHEPLVFFVGKLSTRFFVTNNLSLNILLQFCMMFFPVIAACALFFLVIEKPCMYRDWPQKLWLSLRSPLLFRKESESG